MATSDTTLGMEESDLIAELGELLPSLFANNDPRPTTVKLRESFDVWEIDTSRLKEGIETGELPKAKSEYQHHQIEVDGRVEAYALSKKSSSDSQRVFKAASSPIAKRIDKAITRLDAELDEDTTAWLVVVRQLTIYAFALSDGRVYLVWVPRLVKGLKSGRYMSYAAFMRALAALTERAANREAVTENQVTTRM